MRRTARALVVALAGVAVGTAPAAFAEAASAGPAAKVSPATVQRGDSVTVSVTCAPTRATAPDTINASSLAFEKGTVRLSRVPGAAGQASAPAYRGTARIAPGANAVPAPKASDSKASSDSKSPGPKAFGASGAPGQDGTWTVDGDCPASAGTKGQPWSTELTVPPGGKSTGDDAGAGAGTGTGTGDSGFGGTGSTGSTDGPGGGSDQGVGNSGTKDPDAAADPGDSDDSGDTDDGGASADAQQCGNSKSCDGSSACEESQGASCDEGRTCDEPTGDDTCGSDATEHGVQAGEGSVGNGSVPALVAGAVLILGALGAAVHRLLQRRTDAWG
ncbi:hypothetical protein [Streptomyces sp. NPDC046805]|uniref:hypothetical protein n=1 Tax=Streptomyces sp. NPDC046805 TaxID=3155134 RepID=UPI0033DE0BA1